MAAFEYQALDRTGRVVSGLLDADTPRQARSHLRAQGLLPEVVRPAGEQSRETPQRRAISSAQLSLLTRELATLLGSGLTVEQTLNALTDATTDVKARALVAAVKAEVVAGASLSTALGGFPASFPDFYRALVRAGEEAGALPQVLEHLADYLDARQALRHKTALALLYPAVVMSIAFAIVAGLLAYVVPQVVTVFEQSRQTLPLLTRALIAVSDAVRVSWPVIAVLVVAGVAGARVALRRESVKLRWHGALLRMPLVGAVVSGVDTSRFAATLAILVRGGVPLLSALETAGQTMTNAVLRRAVEQAAERVREGVPLARALQSTGAFPTLLPHLVASGEASGRLGQMLDRAARLEAQALERRLHTFVTLLEPATILAMGAVVLLIVVAILLPVIGVNQLVR